jgi:hypothetical protein
MEIQRRPGSRKNRQKHERAKDDRRNVLETFLRQHDLDQVQGSSCRAVR